ncbi:hypothetical protein [Niveibacterium terrae]|uniref:hypothetical protein n=1 Tax=Niveibacterium terrae TaxID=3373598 RepID=UPI003A92CA41
MKLTMPCKRYVVATIFLALLASVVWVASMRADEFASAVGCKDIVLNRVDSPAGRHALFVFRRECGATSPDSIQANIQPVGVAHDGEKYRAFVVVDGASGLKVKWLGDNQVTVAGTSSARVYRKDHVSDAVQIEYQ